MFDTHKLNEKGFAEVKALKSLMSEAVQRALTYLPDGYEKSVFITKLDEAMFFVTKAIASKTENHTEVTKY